MGRRIKIITLCLVSLLAIGAASAGAASAAPHWTVEGKAFTGTEALATPVLLEKFGTQVTPAYTIHIPNWGNVGCSKFGLTGSIAAESKIASGATLALSGCTMTGEEGEAVPCKIGVGGSGSINSNPSVSGELRTGGAHTYLVLTNVLIPLEIGNCAISGRWQVAGSIAFEVTTGTNTARLSAESAGYPTAKAAGAKLLLGTRELATEAKMGIALSSGKNWGVGL